MVRELRRAGFEAFALEGGYDAWRKMQPVVEQLEVAAAG